MLAPQKPSEKSYDELTKTLRWHFNPKPVVIAERFHFHRRVQSAEESLTEYVAELKKLAQSCNFGGHLDEALRDRLVCGMRSQGAQRRLLAEPDLTLDKALEIALAMEAAEKNIQQLNSTELSVQRVSTPKPHKGGSGHIAWDRIGDLPGGVNRVSRLVFNVGAPSTKQIGVGTKTLCVMGAIKWGI